VRRSLDEFVAEVAVAVAHDRTQQGHLLAPVGDAQLPRDRAEHDRLVREPEQILHGKPVGDHPEYAESRNQDHVQRADAPHPPVDSVVGAHAK
jgi:hypothetical protein